MPQKKMILCFIYINEPKFVELYVTQHQLIAQNRLACHSVCNTDSTSSLIKTKPPTQNNINNGADICARF